MPRKRETHTDDSAVGQAPDLIMPNEGPVVLENEAVQVLDKPLLDEYAQSLAFNEEELTIRIEPSSEENAPSLVDVHVNGRAQWLPVGIPTKVKRKFVEVLARSKPVTVTTKHQGAEVERPENRVVRQTRSRYPFSVISDPNPMGGEWLSRLVMER